MKLVYPSGELEIDFMNRTFENSTPFKLNPHFAETARGRDPLGASVSDFLAAVRGDAPRPALRLAGQLHSTCAPTIRATNSDGDFPPTIR